MGKQNIGFQKTDDDYKRAIFISMIYARVLENKLSSLYKAGKIVGGVYLGKGQEAVSGALGAALIPSKDIFAPLIRDQAGRTAFGEPLIDCARAYLGSALGPMRGRDGNIHRGRPQEGMLAMISHLGSAISVVAGSLFAKRLKGELDGVVGATCIGDGATSTGAFHEGLNMAAVEKLPLVVIVADNQFAYSTPTKAQYACRDLIDRAVGYGVQGHSVDGTDFLACAEVIGHAVREAREGKGTQLVVAKLLRLTGHGEHDDGSYVPDDVKAGQYGRDCIDVAISQLLEKKIMTQQEIDDLRGLAAIEVQSAVAQAQQEPAPDPYHQEWHAWSTKEFYPVNF
jgi:acetoin:2,6-dichlorophenolindophenol oxidoreductase subunit alpha